MPLFVWILSMALWGLIAALGLWLRVPPELPAAAGAERRAFASPTSAGIIEAEIRLGFGGYVVPDAWLPLWVTLRSPRPVDGVLEAVVTRARPPGLARVRQGVHLSPGAAHRVVLPLIIHDVHRPVTVRLYEGERVAAEWRVAPALAQVADGIVLAVSDRPAGLHRLIPPGERVRAAYLSSDELPPRWHEYEGVRVTVLRDLDESRLVPSQTGALMGWVAAGGRLVVVDAPGATATRARILRPLLGAPVTEGTVPGAEQAHGWGRGAVAVMTSDPFRPGLTPDQAAAWSALLTSVPTDADRTLLEALPAGAGVTPRTQGAIGGLLLLYVFGLGPALRRLQGGRTGRLAAAAFLAAALLSALTLSGVVARQTSAVVQGRIARVLPGSGLARVETVGRVAPGVQGTFLISSTSDTLIRPLTAADTLLDLGERARLTGRSAVPIPVRAAGVVPMAVSGRFYEDASGVAVEVDNRTGHPLRGVQMFMSGRVQALPDVQRRGRAMLSPFQWRDPPNLEVARGARLRLLAWTLRHLDADAIIRPTAYLVGWISDERGLLRRDGENGFPLLVVVPLTRAVSAP